MILLAYQAYGSGRKGKGGRHSGEIFFERFRTKSVWGGGRSDRTYLFTKKKKVGSPALGPFFDKVALQPEGGKRKAGLPADFMAF